MKDSTICATCYYKHCICNANFKKFDEFDLHSSFKSELNPDKLSISTITMGFQFGMKDEKGNSNVRIDLEKFIEQFEPTLIFSSCVRSKMFNQVEIKANLLEKNYKMNNISLSLCKNGYIRIAGAKNPNSIYGLIISLEHKIKNEMHGVYQKIGDGIVTMTNPRIQMVNTKFRINKNIRQKDFQEFLFENYMIEHGGPIHLIVKRSDKGAQMNIKYVANSDDVNKVTTRKGREKLKSEISIFVFRTGAISIIGGEILDYILQAYVFINKALCEFFDLQTPVESPVQLIAN